jgi:hypothetical protein
MQCSLRILVLGAGSPMQTRPQQMLFARSGALSLTSRCISSTAQLFQRVTLVGKWA